MKILPVAVFLPKPTENVQDRADEIAELQEGWTTSADEKRIRDLILSTPSTELSSLKRLIDLGGDNHDVLHLLNDAIDDRAIRAQLRALFSSGAPPTGEVKVYSDVDDTLFANLRDPRFPKGTVYPGVRALYTALDRGPSGNDATGDLLFLTARPGFLENSTLDMLKEKGIAEASVLEGKLADFITLSTATRNTNYAATKVENFQAHRAVFPEYGSVFIGDSGQGDAVAGAAMNKLGADKPKAVYIHNVTALTAAEHAAMTKDGIVVFDSYLEVAVDAYNKGLISRQGLRDVRVAARAELNAMTHLSAPQRATAEAALQLAEANETQIP